MIESAPNGKGGTFAIVSFYFAFFVFFFDILTDLRKNGNNQGKILLDFPSETGYIPIMKQREHIMELANRLEEPKNYFDGCRGGVVESPDNILFLRRDPYRRIDTSLDADRLFHRRYALTFNLKTPGLVCVNEKSCPLPEGYAALVYPYQTHRYVIDQREFYWLVITFEATGRVPELMYRSSAFTEHIELLLVRMLELYLPLYGSSRRTGGERLQHYLSCILLELEAEETRIDADTGELSGDPKVRLFEKINGFILSRLGDPELSAREIADAHFISVSLLYTLFNHLAGHNPGEYIRKLRINQALKLLDSRELLVTEVADRTGFSSPAIFSRCFRRETGLSPSEYARRAERK